MKLVALRCVLLALLGLAVGCGNDPNLVSTLGDTSPSDAGDTPTSTDTVQQDTSDDSGPTDECVQTTPQQASDFVNSFTSAVCARAFACQQNPDLAALYTFGGWATEADCVAALKGGVISPGQASQAHSEGSLLFNSCDADTCLSEIPEVDCLAVHHLISENPVDTPVAACEGAFAGQVSTSESCTVSAQCSGASVCNRPRNPEQCTGTCESAGQSERQCGDIVCRFDQYCDTDNNVCMSRESAGSTCGATFECMPDAECDGGTCTEISSGRGEGQECNFTNMLCRAGLACFDGNPPACGALNQPGEDCELVGCAGESFCSSETGKCEALKESGASCTNPQECKSNVCASQTCAPFDSLCP